MIKTLLPMYSVPEVGWYSCCVRTAGSEQLLINDSLLSDPVPEVGWYSCCIRTAGSEQLLIIYSLLSDPGTTAWVFCP